MRVSIVIAVLDSPEVVRRQVEHFKAMPFPKDVELIIVDDGSVPPLRMDDYDLDRFLILHHNIDAEWTQPAARNFGVEHALGEYVIVTDIDHILSLSLIEFVRQGEYDLIRFRREVATLDEHGCIVQNHSAILAYGYEPHRLKKGFRVSPHSNSFAMRRELYLELGGVSERYVGTGQYPNREEIPLKREIKKRDDITICPDGDRPTIYMIPSGRFCGDVDFNPFGLFHDLSRKCET